MSTLRIASCQFDPVVGDLDGNADAIIAAIRQADEAGCDLAVFPRLSICGSPLEDLVFDRAFLDENRRALDRVAAATAPGSGSGCAAVVGFVDSEGGCFDAAAVCAGGAVVGVVHRRVFAGADGIDDLRWFTPGRRRGELYRIAGTAVGCVIGQDMADPNGPVMRLAAAGADVVVHLDATPFVVDAFEARERTIRTRAADAACAVVSVNGVGGRDQCVGDGRSLVVDAAGSLVAREAALVSRLAILDLDPSVPETRPTTPRGRRDRSRRVAVTDIGPGNARRPEIPTAAAATVVPVRDPDVDLWEALVVGTRAFVEQNGFTDVVVGLSGGLDSSAVATIAVDALGSGHVHGVAMPSRYSSDHSVTDAQELAGNLGIDFRIVPIEEAHGAFTTMLAESFAGLDEDLTEENLQARIRGTILMALSNKFGWMVLATGNKSESAVGYATLYGDTAGSLEVVGDVFKTDLYRLCRRRNADEGSPLIPESVLTKAPSAELRPGQRDDQSLPAYEVLDPMLRDHVEAGLGVDALIAAGHPSDVVTRVVGLVDGAEYKRRQSPPALRVSACSFGVDRRVPMTHAFGTARH